jgi:hypothetical protein
MRGILGAVGLSLTVLSGAPAGADEALLSPADVAPLPANVLALTAGGSADAAPLAMASASTAQASISRSTVALAGSLATGGIALGRFGASGGIGSLQAATGIGNIQQNSVAVVLSF